MKEASIIISVDSEYSLINNFFTSLFTSHDCKKYETIVVNDNCTDINTIEYLRRLEREKKIDILITLTDKEGFGRANNAGIVKSTTNYLVLLNTDIILLDKEIDKLLDRMKQLHCQAIQPVLLYPQSGKIQSCGHIFGHLFNRHAYENNNPNILQDLKPLERQALTPAFCIIDRQAFWGAGGFDSFYYNSYEALDLTFKIHLNGGRCYVAPDIFAYHIRMASRAAIPFDEEQQNPYFWTKYATLIKNDYETCISEQLNIDLLSRKYFACIFTHLDLIESIKNVGLTIIESVNMQRPKKIELFGTLPTSFLQSIYPLLFICTNISQLYGNKLWINMRNRKDDLIIDASGNVALFQNL